MHYGRAHCSIHKLTNEKYKVAKMFSTNFRNIWSDPCCTRTSFALVLFVHFLLKTMHFIPTRFEWFVFIRKLKLVVKVTMKNSDRTTDGITII